eukprot:Tbor_TRINITY_DN3588_c0_g1::TRINITY_DN3588_c0_g1_i1::g.2945::m.2945
MPIKTRKKKAAVSKEELERLALANEERLQLEELIRKEREAEERQVKENERRDYEEEEERKRMKKEEQLRLIAQKDARILALVNELESQKMSFTAERIEIEVELERTTHLKDSLLNEISCLRSEFEDVQRNLLEDRALVIADNDELKKNLQEERYAWKQSEEEADMKIEALANHLNATNIELDNLQKEKEANDREMASKIKSQERELEKVNSLNMTLQDVIENREADDRKNVTLMQLLNHQLDETKRKSQEVLDEQRLAHDKVKRQLMTAEAKVQCLSEENDLLKREKIQMQRQSESDLHDYQSKIEQLKFDMKYLHSELSSFKNQCTKQQNDMNEIKSSADSETQSAKLEAETKSKHVEELESLLRRKDREHFDKTTFLNAQISNNRTIISQLQQKLKAERDERQNEVSKAVSEIEAKNIALQLVSDEMDKKRNAAGDVEMKLSSDISILKSTVYQLQSALVDSEKETNAIVAARDEEIYRLRRKLDENFIPHRNEITAADADKSIEVILGEKCSKLTHDIDMSNKVAQEVEVRLKGQLANQGLIIDTLQAELAAAKSDRQEEVVLLESENSHLKQTLELNCIPYKN